MTGRTSFNKNETIIKKEAEILVTHGNVDSSSLVIQGSDSFENLSPKKLTPSPKLDKISSDKKKPL
jgi:hypothetical protein